MKMHKSVTMDQKDIFEAVKLFLETKGIKRETVCSFHLLPATSSRDDTISVNLSTETL